MSYCVVCGGPAEMPEDANPAAWLAFPTCGESCMQYYLKAGHAKPKTTMSQQERALQAKARFQSLVEACIDVYGAAETIVGLAEVVVDTASLQDQPLLAIEEFQFMLEVIAARRGIE